MNNRSIPLICNFAWQSSLMKSNTNINFFFTDAFKLKLSLFLYIFITKVWSPLLKLYTSVARLKIIMYFRQSELLKYRRFKSYILSLYLLLAPINPRNIDNKLSKDLVVKFISQVLSSQSFVCFLLRTVFKKKGEFHHIYPFF